MPPEPRVNARFRDWLPLLGPVPRRATRDKIDHKSACNPVAGLGHLC